jgi:hypothetical protein
MRALLPISWSARYSVSTCADTLPASVRAVSLMRPPFHGLLGSIDHERVCPGST